MVELSIVSEILFVSFVFSFGMEEPSCLLSYKRKKNVKSKAPSPLSTEEKRHLLLWSLLPQLLTSWQIHSGTLNEGNLSPTSTLTNKKEKAYPNNQDPLHSSFQNFFILEVGSRETFYVLKHICKFFDPTPIKRQSQILLPIKRMKQKWHWATSEVRS